MPRAELIGALKALACCGLFVEPKPPPVLPLPNNPPEAFPPPKAGFCADPNKPPLEVLLLLVEVPNPPNPLVVPAVAVPLPKRPPPLDVVEAPKAGRF